VKFYSKTLSWKSSVKHLGNIVRQDLRESDEIRAKQSDFIGKANSVIANFKTVPRDMCAKLFNSQCCSFYGCEAWKITDPDVNAFFVTWRKAVRRLWNLPFTTRSSLLPELMKCKPIQHQIYQRCQLMCSSMLRSDNVKINYISNLSLVNNGLIGVNMAFLRNMDMSFVISSTEKDRANIIRELVSCRERTLNLDQFTDSEIETMLDFMSTF